MYQYDEIDQRLVDERVAQFRDQTARYLAGKLSEDDYRPLRLQNGLYLQLHAYMLRVAIPYGTLSSRQMRQLAMIADKWDKGYGHFTTRQNVQFNWIPLDKSADVMDLLASVNMHGIQTSGNCIRNISCDERAGVAVDEDVDPRPYAELLRQWSTLHPEFAFLPRKFKIAITGAQEDRAAIGWHDVGLRLLRDNQGELGFQVQAGGGMGRTPIIGTVLREFLPAHEILNYLEALVRTYNLWGRRDNLYKARIKILVKAEGPRFIQEVSDEYQRILTQDGAPHTLTEAELARVKASFLPPQLPSKHPNAEAVHRLLTQAADQDKDFARWLGQNVAPHRDPHLRVVTLSFKRLGQAPGDATADQLDAAAELADRFSAGEARVSHDQNLVLPWVAADQLPALYQEAKALGLAKPNIRLLTDMIACPGGDYCALANARSLPIAAAITARYQDLDELFDLGEIDLHISGCINSCGHHHSGHIGVLGVDKDGQEWYQITLGGSDGRYIGGPAQPGKVLGPSFAAVEVPQAIEALLHTYVEIRQAGERFVDTVRRVGAQPFRVATQAVRHITAHATLA